MPADPAAELAAATTAWGDRWWDPERALLWNPERSEPPGAPARTVHLVPPSAWHALGLLRRGAPGDAGRAHRTIEALLDLQYDEPGAPYDGTFARFAEWPHPPAQPVEWEDYDPNWRQFVGCALAQARRFALPRPLAGRVDAAIDRCVRREPPERVPPWYSNIALMRAWLEVEHGRTAGDPVLAARGEAFAADVVERFERHGAFDEYNSATYYGVDLYGLALWRSASPSPRLREWGARLEAALWHDAGRWYHAGLRNLAGPYTRAYTMDLTGSVGLLGLWVWAALGHDHAPVPDLRAPADHEHDWPFGAPIALTGAALPDGAAGHFRAFAGERAVEQRLPDGRVATAWLADHVMLGGERSPIDWGGWEQVHPATAHWRLPDGGVGWLRLLDPRVVEAVARPGALRVRTAAAPIRFEISAPGASALGRDTWELPGLRLDVSGDAGRASVDEEASRRRGATVVSFTPGAPGVHEVAFHVRAAGPEV